MKKLSTRTVRNAFMVLIIIAIGLGAYITADYATDKSVSPAFSISERQEASPGAPPEMPQGDGQNSNPQPPEMPQGDGQNSNSQPPEMPQGDGQNNNSQPPEMKTEGKKSSAAFYVIFAAESLVIAAIIIYLIMSGFNKKGVKETFKGWKRIIIYALSVAIVTACLTTVQGELTMNRNRPSMPQSGEFMPGGEQGGTADASGVVCVDGSTKTLSENYASSTSDESAILVKNGGNATVDGGVITKSGDSTNTENSEFNGINAAVLVQKGSSATIKNAEINTSAKGANAVFATGENAKIYISDSTINSTGEGSARGLDATYGGYIEADHVKITTQGASCAALATDRGEGTVKVKNSTLETNGKGSPVIYSTGDISIENTTGTANGSQNIVIEGKNSATVTDSTLSASGAGNRKDVDRAGVMIYQSMSGDASEGTGTLTATDSTLEIQNTSDYYKTAPMFFVTNTDAVINLKNTKLAFGSGVLLNAAATSEWGNEGSNGGNVTLNAEKQSLTGDVTADSISTVAINLTESSFEGAINGENTAKSVTLKLDKTSKIKLTGDSYVTSLEDEDSSYSNIDFNGFKLYVNGKAVN